MAPVIKMRGSLNGGRSLSLAADRQVDPFSRTA